MRLWSHNAEPVLSPTSHGLSRASSSSAGHGLGMGMGTELPQRAGGSAQHRAQGAAQGTQMEPGGDCEHSLFPAGAPLPAWSPFPAPAMPWALVGHIHDERRQVLGVADAKGHSLGLALGGGTR